jgi:hypothetical protein
MVWFMARWAGFAEPGQRITRPKIARALRREHATDYEGEDEAATVRRLYRISALIKTSDPTETASLARKGRSLPVR